MVTAPASTDPPAGELRSRLAQLSPQQRALLARRLRERAGAGDGDSDGTEGGGQFPRRTGPPPLSFAQERMWFHEQYAPGTTAYTMAVPIRLRGPLDLGVLRRAVRSLVSRHESLRMRFPATAGGEPTVEVTGSARVPFVQVDPVPGTADPADRARPALEREMARPLDLAAGPPLRVVLVRLAGDDHVLAVLVHHIVFDGWSAEILTRELAELYRAFRAGRPSPLPPLPIGYGDFAAWQRRTVKRHGTADAGYWTGRLAGVPPLELPTDRPYPQRQSFTGGWHRFWLDPDLTAAVAGLARAHRATPFMTLLAAFQALLGWYCGQSDFAVGSPVSGRDRAEIEPLIGLFLNTVAIRADLSGDPRFTELVGRVRTEAVQAYAHQAVPFEQVVAQLRLPRDPRRSAVFQVLFDLQGWPRPDPRDRPASLDCALTVTRFEAHNPATRHELALHLAPVGDRLEGYLTYCADLFDPATVERLCQRYLTILRQVTVDPGRRLSELDLLDGPERAQVLAWADGGPVGMDRMPATLGGVLDRTLASTPDAPAVVQDGQAMSFRELDRRATRLARHLRRLGVEPDARVGICLPPTFDQAVAVLAVLRSGGAYLPLDPEQPPARLAFLLADAGAAVLVTDAALAGRVPDYPGRVVAVDRDAAAIGSAGTGPLPVTVGPEQLAYVIYTSGSTGVPKGVAVGHGPVLRYLAGLRDRLQLPTGARFGLLQSLAYDFSVTMFYLPLLTGGCVHLIPRRSTGEQLAGYLATEGIDCLKLTPSHLAALAGEVPARRLLPRRALLLGGEAFGAELAYRLAADSTVAVFNHYGPTEASVGVTMYRVPAGGRVTAAGTPIGRPLPGARAYVLDQAMRPVPVGAVGQLYLGGDRLARGYLGRPEQTAQAFVHDPFGEACEPNQKRCGEACEPNQERCGGPPGARLYRTGDLARWLPDGNLEFRGRRDHQVKVRGYRVEPAEVEAALAGFPEVAQAVAVARVDRLVAYLEKVAGAPELPVSEVRARLAGTLPEHLLPSRVVWLDRLPLLPHGKVDRRSLPEPAADRPDQAVGYAEPDGPVETAIARVWAEALGLDRVGVRDDFFDLGGHSLLATRVASRLRQVLPPPARPVTVLDLFLYPTVRRLAGHAARAGDGDQPARLLHDLTPAGPEPVTRSVVCVPYGGASAVVYRPLAEALPPGYALHAVTLPGHDIGDPDSDPDRPDRWLPVAELAARCVAEIRDRVTGPLVVYGHCGPGGALAMEIARQLAAGGREPEAVLLGGVFPFSRPTGPLDRLSRAFRLDRLRSDTRHANWLQALGADLGRLDPAERRFLIRAMRRDAEAAEEYFSQLLHSRVEPLAAPVVSVVGERDPATEFYQERYREWDYLTGTTALVVLDEAGHYFLKYRAGELASIITQVPEAVAADPPWPGSATWRLQEVSSGRPAGAGAGPGAGSSAEPAHRTVRPSMRRFLAVAASQFISATGTALTEFAFPIWAYLDTGSLLRFTLFAVAGLLPGILVLPLAGVIVDRTSRRRVLLASSVVAGSIQLTLAVLVLLDRLPVGPLYGLLALLSVALAFQRLGFTSAVPQLVPKMYLGHANGVVQLTTTTANFLVPLLAVGLLSTIGLAGILAIDVASYLVAVVVLLLIRFPAAMPGRRREAVSAEIREGFRYLWWRPGLRAMLLFFVAINVFVAAVLVLISPLVLSVGTLANAGLVASVASLGGVAGGLVMAVWGGPRHHRMRGVLWSTVAFAGAAVLIGARPSLPLIATGAFGLWLAMTIQSGIWLTIVMVKVPHRIHGRVLALNFVVAQSVVTLGFLLAPLASSWLDPLLEPGGALAGSVGSLIGVGPGRGIALLYLICAAAISVISLIALRWTILARFDRTVPDAEPDDLVGLATLSRRGGADRGQAAAGL